MADNILGQFIRMEMLNRSMNQAEFAKAVGVSQSTIARYLSHNIKDPGLDFLVKLANATHVDICALIAIIRPDAFKSSPNAKMVAERIERLPARQRELIETFLTGMMLSDNQNGDDVS